MVLPMSVINLWLMDPQVPKVSTAMNLVFSHRLMQWRKHYFEYGTKLKKPFVIKPLLKRAMRQEMKMTMNMQLRIIATWTNAIWDGTAMVKRPISCPLTGLMYQCVLKASCLTFTVYLMIRKCNLSLRNIHCFLTEEAWSHGGLRTSELGQEHP